MRHRSKKAAVTGLYLENRFSIVLMAYILFERIHRLCSHEHYFQLFFLEILIPMNSRFRCRPVHILLILRLGRIRWNSSKCRDVYCIGYHVKFSLISICWYIISVASYSSRYVVLSFKFYSSLHLSCYCEKKNKLAVHVLVYVRFSLFTLGCLRNGVKSTVTLIEVLYTVFDIEVKFLYNS